MSKFFDITFWQVFLRDIIDRLITGGTKILMLLVIYLIVKKLLAGFVDAAMTRLAHRQELSRSPESSSRILTLKSLVGSIVGYLLTFILIIMLLDALGANITGIVTTAGVSGLAIGFGAQKLVKDVISGFFLIVEDQFQVGEYVTIGAVSGIVEELGMRTTRLKDDQGRLVMLANGDIVSVINHSRSPVHSFIEISVGAEADINLAEEKINLACKDLYEKTPKNLQEPPHTLGISALDGAKVTIRISVVATPCDLTLEQMRVRETVRNCLLLENITLV
jgi:small conductance mechanosensitive channel